MVIDDAGRTKACIYYDITTVSRTVAAFVSAKIMKQSW